MEVHAHTHTARKKWTHYLWEFIMLFLAVFCGFLAAYKLGHTIEHQQEKKLVQSLVHDLASDTQRLTIADTRCKPHQPLEKRISSEINLIQKSYLLCLYE